MQSNKRKKKHKRNWYQGLLVATYIIQNWDQVKQNSTQNTPKQDQKNRTTTNPPTKQKTYELSSPTGRSGWLRSYTRTEERPMWTASTCISLNPMWPPHPGLQDLGGTHSTSCISHLFREKSHSIPLEMEFQHDKTSACSFVDSHLILRRGNNGIIS